MPNGKKCDKCGATRHFARWPLAVKKLMNKYGYYQDTETGEVKHDSHLKVAFEDKFKIDREVQAQKIAYWRHKHDEIESKYCKLVETIIELRCSGDIKENVAAYLKTFMR